MEFKKVIDKDYLQVYTIIKPSKEWISKYPHNSVIISFNNNTKTVMLRNTDNAFDWKILNSISYIFTTLNEKAVKKMFSSLPYNDSMPFNKHCGLNPVDQTLYTADKNVILSIFSLQECIYSPNYIAESINVKSSYDEIMNTDNKQFHEVINKIVKTASKPLNSFVNFIDAIYKSFPFNYMATLRRFNEVIKEDDLKKETNNNKYYIGYDMRYGDLYKENKLIHKMEDLNYNDTDKIVIFETYNNPMSKIIQQLKAKDIKFKQIHEHCIQLNVKDYNKLKLVSTITDFI